MMPMLGEPWETAVASSLFAKIFQVAAGVVAITGATIAGAYADVGVTSATDGDPLGRPPTLAERVLRVGINIQANEVISTKADDRAHILFLDGTSLTVAPNAELVIDKYVYDPNTKTGDLAVSVSKGVLRLVGGKISKNTPMVVKTPSATIGIRGGIAVIAAEARQTEAKFLFGTAMTVTANGRTETATRAGSQIVTRLGEIPGVPTVIPAGSMTSQMAALEGRTSKSDRKPDEVAKQSGFSSTNSGQAVVIPQPAVSMQSMNKVAVQALSNASAERQPAADATPIVTFVSALPQSPPPSVVTPGPVVTPVTPVGPTTGGSQTFASPIVISPGLLPTIQKPASTAVAGVGSGSMTTPPPTTTTGTSSTPLFPTTTRTTTFTTSTDIRKDATGKPATTGNTGTTKPTTTVLTTTTAIKPPTTVSTTTTTTTKNGATPAVGVGNGGLIRAVPPTHSRGGNNNIKK